MRSMMWAILAAASMATTALPVCAEDYHVFIVAGQSNCDGRGDAKQLTGELAKWAKPQADVIITYSCSSVRGPIRDSGGFKPLQTGWSVAPGKNRPLTLPSNTFGPELAFGRGLTDQLKDKKIALIKFAEGGTSLAKDWNPEVKERLYPAFLEFTRKSLKELKDQGHTYTIRGMIWHQGESDAALTAEDYQKRLTAFITAVRTDLKVADLPFGIGEVYDNNKRNAVREAQHKTAQSVKGAFLVSCEGLKTFDGGTHFDAASQIELGNRFATGMVKALEPR